MLADSPVNSISELAVLVFVHGDSWSWGSSHLYDARILATLGRIIVVTFNYRLGVFGESNTADVTSSWCVDVAGFLNTNPSPMTKGHVGNFGLLDQMAALHWVEENVRQFGGDSSRITLMGQVVASLTKQNYVYIFSLDTK